MSGVALSFSWGSRCCVLLVKAGRGREGLQDDCCKLAAGLQLCPGCPGGL